MSEKLKVHKIGDLCFDFKMGKDVGIDFYRKSEADKVIEKLERDIVKLKSSLKYLVVRGLIDGPVKEAAEDVLKEVEDAH